MKSLTRLWIYGFCFTNFFFWNVYVLLHVLSSKVLSWSRKTSEGCTSWVIILRQIILPGNKLQVICELIIAETFAILNKESFWYICWVFWSLCKLKWFDVSDVWFSESKVYRIRTKVELYIRTKVHSSLMFAEILSISVLEFFGNLVGYGKHREKKCEGKLSKKSVSTVSVSRFLN